MDNHTGPKFSSAAQPERQHAPHSWPQLRWRHPFWLTLIPFLLAFAVFFWPAAAASEFPMRSRLVVGMPLLLAPIWAPLGLWCLAAFRIAVLRISEYSTLHQSALSYSHDLSALKADLYKIALERQRSAPLDLLKATIVDGTLFISIAKNSRVTLAEEDPLVVIDQTDGLLMGMFKVVQAREVDYYAAATSGVNALWKGHVYQLGEATMFPNFIALPLREGGSP